MPDDSPRPDPPTCALFEPHVGSRFTLSDESGASVALTLTKAATDERARASWMTRMPFHLLFQGPPDAVIPNDVFRLSHPELGEIGRVLVTPVIDPDRPGQPNFQVVFN
jgi:hypothetical protein